MNVNEMNHEEFMEYYEQQHYYCPICGSEDCSSTFVGFLAIQGKYDMYKDSNKCVCMNCGDIHITHNRVSEDISHKF